MQRGRRRPWPRPRSTSTRRSPGRSSRPSRPVSAAAGSAAGATSSSPSSATSAAGPIPTCGRSGRSRTSASATWPSSGIAAPRSGRPRPSGRRPPTSIRREVSQAVALSAARSREIEVSRVELASAEAGYREDLTRARGAVGRPIEVLDSLKLLNRARQNLIRALVEYRPGPVLPVRRPRLSASPGRPRDRPSSPAPLRLVLRRSRRLVLRSRAPGSAGLR